MTANESLLQVIYNAPSYRIATASTQACVTRVAGMLAPVTFFANSDRPVQPYHIAPWWKEGVGPEIPSLLGTLRGDFFCAPFGGNEEPVDGLSYPPHGESANRAWAIENVRQASRGVALAMTQAQTVRSGMIRKQIALVEGESVVYQRHDLIGMQGPIDLGHHPNLEVPEGTEPGYLSFAPHRLAHTWVEPTERPENKGYSLLKPNTPIDDLRACPTITGEPADLTRWPARRGFTDIIIICAKPDLDFGWSAFALPSLGYVWFSLKNPRSLVSTLLWFSNGGRYYAPWDGRHVNTIGMEDITGFFHAGLAASIRENFLEKQGIPTKIMLDPNRPTTITHIQGVARIGADFGPVKTIERAGEGRIRILGEGGSSVEVEVDWSFLEDGKLKDLIE